MPTLTKRMVFNRFIGVTVFEDDRPKGHEPVGGMDQERTRWT
jgi:hypothetical protein